MTKLHVRAKAFDRSKELKNNIKYAVSAFILALVAALFLKNLA